MIVIGADTHKRSHTCAAVDAAVGELVAGKTATARRDGFEALLVWARSLGGERVWAVEDCRHVSGSFERFLIARGERIVRVAPHLSARERRSMRQRGKSDPIDAIAIAGAALRAGLDELPTAVLDDDARAIQLLVDHREQLVSERTRRQNRLRWLLHDRWPELDVPAGALDRERWLETIGRRLARAEQTVDVRVCRELVREIRAATRRARELERELTTLVCRRAPKLLDVPGCGTLTAARLIAETAQAERFATDAKFARAAGVAPIPASSGARHRYRLDRGGNRQLNAALHRIAIVQGRTQPEGRAYLARRQSEGKTRREAIRALKRHLARRVWQILRTVHDTAPATPAPAVTTVCTTPFAPFALT